MTQNEYETKGKISLRSCDICYKSYDFFSSRILDKSKGLQSDRYSSSSSLYLFLSFLLSLSLSLSLSISPRHSLSLPLSLFYFYRDTLEELSEVNNSSMSYYELKIFLLVLIRKCHIYLQQRAYEQNINQRERDKKISSRIVTGLLLFQF